MIHLSANTIGPMVSSRNFDGTVHSVFNHVVNLELKNEGIISIGNRNVPNGPGLIKCNTTLTNFGKHVDQDMSVRCIDNIIYIENKVSIELKTGIPWAQRIYRSKFGTMPRNWEYYYNVVLNEPTFSTTQKILCNSKCVLEKKYTLINALQPLVGKGPGLTPLGDDFILGVTAGLNTYNYQDEAHSIWLLTLNEFTTDLSWRSLFHAASKWFSEPIVDFIKDVFGNTISAKPPQILSIGDTSGTATAYGCLIGIKVASSLVEERKNFS